MRVLFFTAFILMLAGCASSGPTIDNAQLAELQKGRTTADDVLRRFGKPSFNSDNLDGTRTTAYLQAGYRSDASAMVSLISAIASGTTANANSIIFRFDSNGVLSSYERTSESPTAGMTARSETGAATGFAPGTPPQPAATRAAPAKRAPRPDNLPAWLPSSDTRDLRDLNN